MDNDRDELHESSSVEAPEDDDFGDFEGPEDEAPEAVQAMVSGPNWIFPDLVRVRSNNQFPDNSNPNGPAPGSNNSRHHYAHSSEQQSVSPQASMLRATPTTSSRNSYPLVHRVLDPPDVSLLSSTAALPQPSATSTLDLCTSVLERPGPSSSFFIAGPSSAVSVVPTNSNPNISSSTSKLSPSSPSSPSQSSSGTSSHCNSTTSSTATNLSSLKDYPTSAGPSTSSPNLAASNPSSSNQIEPNRLLSLENEIRSLQMHKALLQQQLLQKDTQISELLERSRVPKQAAGPNPTSTNLDQFEERLFQRLDSSLGRLENTLQSSINGLEQRIDLVESRLSLSSSAVVPNGECTEDSVGTSSSSQIGPDVAHSADLIQTLIESQRRENEQHRMQMLDCFAGILQSSLDTVNHLSSSSSSSLPPPPQPTSSHPYRNPNNNHHHPKLSPNKSNNNKSTNNGQANQQQ